MINIFALLNIFVIFNLSVQKIDFLAILNLNRTYILANFRMNTIVIEAITPFGRTSLDADSFVDLLKVYSAFNKNI